MDRDKEVARQTSVLEEIEMEMQERELAQRKKMRGDTGASEPVQGQVRYEIQQLEKNVAFLLECSSTLHNRLESVLNMKAKESKTVADRSDLCDMASWIRDQNDKLENLSSGFTDLLHNLEI